MDKVDYYRKQGRPGRRNRGIVVDIMQVVLWALLTGGITGGVWTAIVLFGRQKRLARENTALLEDRQRALDALEQLTDRVGELEERLEFTERVLHEPPARPTLPPAH